MKKQLLILMLIIAAQNNYSKDIPLSKTPNFRISLDNEETPTLEKSSYEDLLRMVDEINRKNGLITNYFVNGTNIGEEYTDVKFVPVAQYTGNENFKDSLPFDREGNQKRVYLGNGNSIKDFKIITSDEYNKLTNSKNNKYTLEGTYKNINKIDISSWDTDGKRNPLKISVDEYFKNIDGKSRKEIAKYLEPKLNQFLEKTDSKVILKEGELYTKEKDGSEWKILWEIEPVSIHSVWPEGFKDDILAKIYIYDSTKSDKDSRGRIIYQNDGSILIEDKYDYSKNNENSKKLGKNIEFRGKGRIDGEINLGKGSNHLIISEQFTGKYGTNVILGPYAKLKNIDVVEVGGQIGSDSSASLSGRTSLALDIDPKIKNEKGYLIQHALKDSDKNIIFRSPSTHLNKKYKNDFSIELMTSKINNDSVIDIGRSLYTKDNNEKDYHITLIPDSIANNIIELDEKSKDGNSLIKVEIKDKLKGLNNSENQVYLSLKNSKNLSALFPTLTTTNKRTNFTVEEDEKELEKDKLLATYLRTKTADDILKDLSQFNFSDKQTLILKEKIKNIQNNDIIKDDKIKREELKAFSKINFDSDTLENHISKFKEKIKVDYSKLDDESRNKLASELEKYYQENLKSSSDVLLEISNDYNNKISSIKNLGNKISYILETIKTIKNYKESDENSFDDWDYWGYNYNNSPNSKSNKIERYFKEIEGYLNDIPYLIKELKKENEEKLDIELIKELKALENRKDIFDYKELHSALYYTQRQEEVLKELQTLINQVQNKNIYSRLNKVAKDEISTFTSIPFDVNNDFSVNKNYVHGGSILTKNSYDSFKGNIYSGYGIYETEINNMNFGFIVGGATSNHNEIKNDTLKEVTTESKIKGVSAYLGGYNRNFLTPKLQWLNGLGIQYGEYEVNREFKNNYQQNIFTSNSNVYGVNLYSGLNYQYSLKDDLSLNFKGLVSYSFISQEDIKEKDAPLALNIKAQNYNYLDSELGVSLNKTIFNPNSKNTLSGGIFGKFGILGYDNKNLNGKFNDSTSSMEIQGNKFEKNSIKLVLNYDVSLNSGINYGLEGTYTTNNEYNNITFGLKAGYRF